MVARGEIGFLIFAVAGSRGIFSSAGGDGTSELFSIITWAIMLCTIVRPIGVGLLMRRVRKLQLIVERLSGRASGSTKKVGCQTLYVHDGQHDQQVAAQHIDSRYTNTNSRMIMAGGYMNRNLLL